MYRKWKYGWKLTAAFDEGHVVHRVSMSQVLKTQFACVLRTSHFPIFFFFFLESSGGLYQNRTSAKTVSIRSMSPRGVKFTFQNSERKVAALFCVSFIKTLRESNVHNPCTNAKWSASVSFTRFVFPHLENPVSSVGCFFLMSRFMPVRIAHVDQLLDNFLQVLVVFLQEPFIQLSETKTTHPITQKAYLQFCICQCTTTISLWKIQRKRREKCGSTFADLFAKPISINWSCGDMTLALSVSASSAGCTHGSVGGVQSLLVTDGGTVCFGGVHSDFGGVKFCSFGFQFDFGGTN